jgi:hypothetical protein
MNGQPKVTASVYGEDRAEHHRAALREVDRARHRVGDVEAEREQPVHAAERETADQCGGYEHKKRPPAAAVLSARCEPYFFMPTGRI